MRDQHIYAAAETFLSDVPDDWTVVRGLDDYPAINPKAIQEIANELQAVIASVIASLIDAGSERDAVNENEELNNAIKAELRGWC